MRITQMLARNAQAHPEATALVERTPTLARRRVITWGQFDEQANRLARALTVLGVAKASRVVVLMTNCIEWLPVYFGILRTGAWAVPLNFRFDADAILACARTAEPSVVIFGEPFIERIHRIKADLDRTVSHYVFVGPDHLRPCYAIGLADLIAAHPASPPDVAIGAGDAAALYFTSGTTGTPKAALLTHANLEFACMVENHHHGQTRADNFLCIPPLYHTGAKMHWFGNLIVGAPAVILNGVTPRWILDAVSQEGVTIVWLLVPWALDILLAIENGEVNLADYRLDQWRLMHIGAQPVPPSLIRQWRQVFPHHQYDTNYGLTEASGPGCVHLGIDNRHKVGAIGKPGFGWQCKIVDIDGRTVDPGTPGELAVKGEGVMQQYYRNPEATARVLRDGWLMTGDIARADADGFIWLVDRAKDVIITGGENIYPVEIEDFLQAHPDIQDVAVIGLPDARLGEIVAAIIAPKPGRLLSQADITVFCEDLPRYKRPRRIIFDEVPRNPTGKIEKPRLRRRYAGAGQGLFPASGNGR